ncbi:hypothetical protein [Paraburkholderia phenazinium]|uniref:hypothetical protein n=1 Tax=Paraburkholderia phenazinium TaxID=60549 RepID=UPI00158C473F|nr:hypothetical protein [Paraburkholderia phenazinium]
MGEHSKILILIIRQFVPLMSSKKALVAIGTILSLAACSGRSDLNETNLSAAISKHLAAAPLRCVANFDWPVLTPRDARDPFSVVTQGRALAIIGFVAESPAPNPPGYVLFSLTDEGKKHLMKQEIQPDPDHFVHGAFCYGRPVLDKVSSWEPLVKVADYEGTTAQYTYTVIDAPAWSKRAEIQNAFPQIANDLSGKGRGKWPVLLVNGQWEPQPM